MKQFFEICEFFNISPSDFFDIENKDPQLTKELVAATRNMDEEQMRLLIDIASNFDKQSPKRGSNS